MRTVIILLAALAISVIAGQYDDIKAQIKALADSQGSGGSSGQSVGSSNWIPDEEYYKTHYKNGKKKGIIGRTFGNIYSKVKGIIPGGKNKKKGEEQPAPITLNDYTQETHLHLHKDDHFHNEKHLHHDYNSNLIIDDHHPHHHHHPSYYHYYRHKREAARRRSLKGSDGKKKSERARVVIQF